MLTMFTRLRRRIKRLTRPADGTVLDLYVRTAPSPAHAVDIFEGEWVSRFPPPHDGLPTGPAPLFADHRIAWLIDQCGGDLAGQSVLELGPLEAGHTFMLEQAGAAAITAIEANTRAYLKCLIVKELFDLKRARFLCGDFIEYLRDDPGRFDLLVASGVLYHMTDPVELIALAARAADRVFLWTHYYDAAVIDARPNLRSKFVAATPAEYRGFRHTLHHYSYGDALNHLKFCGAGVKSCRWLSRDDLLGALAHFGLTRQRFFGEDRDHIHGPCLSVLAERE